MARVLLFVCALLVLTGCHGMVAANLEARGVKSCLFWNSQLTGLRAVSATGGLPIEACLSDPCRGR